MPDAGSGAHTPSMSRFLVPALALALALLAPALPAQDSDATPPGEEEGFSLMEEGARLIMRGILQEMEPALEELESIGEEMRPAFRELAEQMGPALVQLMELIDEIGHYEAPEVLENGDIIIRRKPDAPAYEPPEAAPIDL